MYSKTDILRKKLQENVLNPDTSAKKTFITEGVLEFYQVDDGGLALIADLANDDESDKEMFVKLQSWSESKSHTELVGFVGRKIRITVETIG